MLFARFLSELEESGAFSGFHSPPTFLSLRLSWILGPTFVLNRPFASARYKWRAQIGLFDEEYGTSKLAVEYVLPEYYTMSGSFLSPLEKRLEEYVKMAYEIQIKSATPAAM